MNYILAIDQGTHASRALVLNNHGQIVARHLAPVEITRPHPDRVEQDAGRILDSVKRAVSETLAQLPATQRDAVNCCGIATQRSTVLAWQRNGIAVSPALNWQDIRGAPQLASLQQHRHLIQQLSGLPLSPHYGATKLHELYRMHAGQPDLCLGPLAAFLVNRLGTGDRFSVDHGNAQRMQLLDIHSLDWSKRLCDWFGVPAAHLPRCQPVRSDFGALGDHDIPLTAVSGDQNAAWFDAGEPPAGSVLVNIGSGAFVLTAQTTKSPPAGLLSSIVYSNGQRRQYVIEGTVNGAGNALQWLQTEFRIPDVPSRLGSWLEQVSEPPLFMNTVGGLGSPWWRQRLPPLFVDDDGRFSHAERAAAVAESILFLVQYNLERIAGQQPVRHLRVSGGLSRVDALCRKLASLTQCPVRRSDDSEASARGVAWLAADCPADWTATNQGQLFEPTADLRLAARYRNFIEQLECYVKSQKDD